MGLTVHGLQSDQAGDKVVKVDGHVGLRVAQDDQLEQVVGQLETWERKQENQERHTHTHKRKATDSCVFSCRIREETAPAESRAILIS